MNRLSFEIMVIPPTKNNTAEEDPSPTRNSRSSVALWFQNSKIQPINNSRQVQTVFYKARENKNIEFSLRLTDFKSIDFDVAHIFEFSIQEDIHWKNMSFYDDFIKEFEIIVQKNRGKCLFLDRKLSKYYSEKMYPLFNDFENELRRLIQVVFFKELGREWEERAFLPKQLRETNRKPILEELNLTGLETLLFKKIFAQKGEGDGLQTKLIRVDDTPDALNDLLDFFTDFDGRVRRFSAWDEYFSKYMKSEFQGKVFIEKYKKVKKIRNKVAHNKKVRNEDFQFIKTFLVHFTEEIKSLSTSMIHKTELPSFGNSFALLQTFAQAFAQTYAQAVQNALSIVSANVGNIVISRANTLTGMFNPVFLESLNKISQIGTNNFDYSDDEDIDDLE